MDLTVPGHRVLRPTDPDAAAVLDALEAAEEVQLLLAEPWVIVPQGWNAGRPMQVPLLLVKAHREEHGGSGRATREHLDTVYIVPLQPWKHGLGASARLASALQRGDQIRVRHRPRLPYACWWMLAMACLPATHSVCRCQAHIAPAWRYAAWLLPNILMIMHSSREQPRQRHPCSIVTLTGCGMANAGCCSQPRSVTASPAWKALTVRKLQVQVSCNQDRLRYQLGKVLGVAPGHIADIEGTPAFQGSGQLPQDSPLHHLGRSVAAVEGAVGHLQACSADVCSWRCIVHALHAVLGLLLDKPVSGQLRLGQSLLDAACCSSVRTCEAHSTFALPCSKRRCCIWW